tara:strand:- start:156 stop:692 length:537 start_codon:yes stop_codon:yes gene_type:complete
MHFYNLKFYCFVDQFNKKLLDNLTKNVSIIYRNYSLINHLPTIKKIKQNCKKRGLKFYLSNNVKLAIKLDLDGAYIPSFNKNFDFISYNLKKKFLLLGSAHSLKEIRIKEKQKVSYIFLSPLFKNDKNKKNLGILKFINLKNYTKINIVALGGIKKTNLNIIKNHNIFNVASISLFQQ